MICIGLCSSQYSSPNGDTEQNKHNHQSMLNNVIKLLLIITKFGSNLMPYGIEMAKTSWPQIEQSFKDNWPVILPLGAGCKEHGHHLPMNTDKIIAEYLASWAMDNYHVLVAPTLEYNFFPAFEEYPGSATLPFDLSVQLVVELCISWHKQGAQQFYVLNTGISTNRVLSEARDILARKSILFNYFDFSALDEHETIKGISKQKVGTHADEIETSIMLFIKPDVVDMSKAKVEESPDKPGPLTRDISATNKTISVTGAWGNPTLATYDKGEIAVDILKEMLQNDFHNVLSLEMERSSSTFSL